MYLYSGYDIYKHPDSWTWAIRGLPATIQQVIDKVGIHNFLLGQGVVEMLFGAVLILWFTPKRLVKWVALFSALEMALILVFVGIDSITFRDLGLLGASLALWLIYSRR